MKKTILLLSSFLFSVAVFAQTTSTTQTANPTPDELVKFNTIKYDFGKLKQNIPATYNFEIKNISKKPVVVESASGSCGCTVPEIPKGPVAPGSTEKMKVSFNAAALGVFTKTVTVKLAGITQTKEVQITGEVLDAAKYDEYEKTKPKK